MSTKKPEPEITEIIVEYEWSVIIERLSYHRNRLDISKKEMSEYIWETYKKSFWRLSDRQILDLGLTLAHCKHKSEIIF